MRKGLGLLILCIGLIVLGGCGKKSTAPNQPVINRLYFTPDSLTIAPGQTTHLDLRMEGESSSIFAISLRIGFADTILTFSDSLGVLAGNFFAGAAILFTRTSDSVIHLSISRVSAQTAPPDSNTICTLIFTGRAPGVSPIRILPEDLVFYDVDGEPIGFPLLETAPAVIKVE